MKVKNILLLVSLFFVFSLVACGGDGNGDGGSASDDEQTLIFGRGADSFSMDPQDANEIETWRVTKNIYETLVEYDDETTEIKPKLAKEWEDSEDGLTWTFELEEGIKFHDGTDFNAEAVVYNFERMMDTDHPEHVGEFSVYRGMFNGFKDDGSNIENIKAVDDYTVEFELTVPMANFLQNIAMHAFGIISPEALQEHGGEGIKETGVGTGPFKFVSWSQNDSVVLEKNEDYWVEDLPELSQIIYKVIPDNSARLTALKNNEVDILVSLNPSDVESIENEEDLEIELRPPLNVGYLSINNTKEPLDDPLVRRALNHAVDKEGIAEVFFYGLGEPAVNMLPKDSWAHNDEVEDYEYDLDKAKELLEEAGYPDGFEIEFSVTSNSRIYMQQPTKMVEAMKTNFEEIGIDVSVVPLEWAEYIEQLRNGEHALGLIGWVGDNGDPDNFLYSTLSKNNAVEGAAQNHMFYINDEVSNLLMDAKSEMDEGKRKEMYDKVQEIVKEDAPTVPLVEVQEPVVVNKSVKNYFPHPTGAENMYEVTFE